MISIGGRSIEEEILDAECSGDEDRKKKLFLLENCLGRLGWDVSLEKNFLDGFSLLKEKNVVGVKEGALLL